MRGTADKPLKRTILTATVAVNIGDAPVHPSRLPIALNKGITNREETEKKRISNASHTHTLPTAQSMFEHVH